MKNTRTMTKEQASFFADLHKDKCRYNTTAKEWYIYNSKVWLPDAEGMIVSRLVKKMVDELIQYAMGISDEQTADRYLKYLLKLRKLSFRETIVKDARDKYCICAGDLDSNVDLINCLNGTYDLKSLEFRKHKASDMLSKISNVVYDENACTPEFEKFMDEIMEGDGENIKYLQKILGYSLTTDTSMETCFLLYGPTTRNGKSTLVETIGYVLGGAGGYALTMNPETLAYKLNSDGRQASGDIARLKDCRFLKAREPSNNMVFDAGLLKALLGRDTITARHLYEREMQFVPGFKLFINTNHLPVILDDTLFTSGRLTVIPFNRHFDEASQDKTLKERLKSRENISGIFNYCLEGLKLFREEGAEAPQSIISATNHYRKNSAKIDNFIEECLEPAQTNLKAKDVYEAFSRWCDYHNYGVENKSKFYDELRTKGLLRSTGTVCGQTVKNVVAGYKLPKDYIRDCEEGIQASLRIVDNKLSYDNKPKRKWYE